MKKTLTSIFILSFSLLSFGQVSWFKDFETAQQMALSNDKLIVMDFWAIWCGPCRTMDAKMWNTPEINSQKDNYVFLKIDVDINPVLAKRYQATSIPKVIIMDPTGEPIWEQVGFRSADSYMEAFESLSIESLPTNDFLNVIQEKNVESAKFNIGLWYQKLGSDPEAPFAEEFLKASDSYLKDVTKSDNESLALEADFNLILNYAFKGNVKKALKKVQKMDDDEMKNFVLAYCYKCEGQTELMQKFRDKIASEDLLARLED